MGLTEAPVPDESFPVKMLLTEAERTAAKDPVECGTCNRWWDDAIPTSLTPAPSARCPFEYFHHSLNEGKRVVVHLPRPYPEAILDGILDVILAHEDRLALLDRNNPGFGINCACGKNFPPRVPDGDWVPEELTKDEWAAMSEEERRELLYEQGHNIRIKTASRDYYRHVATCILDLLQEVD